MRGDRRSFVTPLVSALLLLLQLSAGFMAHAGTCDGDGARVPDVTDYWPEVAGDLRLVTWAHAVNSRAELDAALEGDIMMLEADVSIAEDGVTPIMAHPPSTSSDLTLEQFVDGVAAQDKRKGMKLDFKSTAAFEAAVPVLSAAGERGALCRPVWLNADIAAGPGGSPLPGVKASRFLELCGAHFPGRALSVGWTTGTLGRSYSERQVRAMEEALRAADVSAHQPLTFPVRAKPAAHSSDTLLPLLSHWPLATFTFWGSSSDKVDNDALLHLAEDAGFDRVYVDLPSPVPGLTPNTTAADTRGGGIKVPGGGAVRAVLSPAVVLISTFKAVLTAAVQRL